MSSSTSNILDNIEDSPEKDESMTVPMDTADHNDSINQQPKILFDDKDEDEEDDEVLVAPVSMSVQTPATSVVVNASQEFTEAAQAISNNSWDINNWMQYLDEAKRGHSGSISVVDAYNNFFQTFPRAYQKWADYLDYAIFQSRPSLLAARELEDIFNKILPKCRDVDVWLVYLRFQQQVLHPNEFKFIESLYEQASERIGYSIHASKFWKEYLHFIKSSSINDATVASSSNDSSQVNAKLTLLRKIYQKICTIPMDNLEAYWKEYESLEKQAGEHLAEKVLPEFREKVLHAKTIYLDRKKFSQSINFHYLACPSSLAPTLEEIQQLDHWNKWLK